jgi:hypothetical protein
MSGFVICWAIKVQTPGSSTLPPRVRWESCSIYANKYFIFVKNLFWNAYQHPNCFVICNTVASDRRINLFDRLQHARYEHSIVVASVYKRLRQPYVLRDQRFALEPLLEFVWKEDGDCRDHGCERQNSCPRPWKCLYIIWRSRCIQVCSPSVCLGPFAIPVLV